MDIARLVTLPVSQVWRNETHDFTPWLERNLDLLGEALNLNLEPAGREVKVGNYALDLLATDAGTGKYVAIENQTKETDHDHMGKALTYAAGLEARFVVWIAADFRDEHRAAIDWLNRMTTDEVDFFGVRVAAVKIEDSPPAALFTVAAAPNEWPGQVKDTLNPPSARQVQYRGFWEPLLSDLNETRGWRVSTDNRKSRYDAGSGFTARFGSSGVGAVAGYFGRTLRFTQNGEARVEWNIQSRVRQWNKDMFDRLFEYRISIESELGELEWERLDGAIMSRIAAVLPGTIDDGEESLDEIRQWMLETVNRLPDVMAQWVDKVLENMDPEGQ